MTSGYKPFDPIGGVSMPKAPENSGFIATGSQWINILGVGNVVAYAWNDSTATANPGINQISCNNASIALATELYINESSFSGVDSTAILEIISELDFFVINRLLDQANNWSVKVAGPSVDNGGWFTIPIEVVDSAGSFLDGFPLSVHYVPTSHRSVFGNDYQYEASEGVSSEATTTWQNKVTLTTPSLVAGTYSIWASAEVTNGSSNQNTEIRVRIDSTEELFSFDSPKTASEYSLRSGLKDSVLTAGIHVVELDFRSASMGGTALVRRARLKIFRVT